MIQIQQFYMHNMMNPALMNQSYENRIVFTSQEYLKLVQKSTQCLPYNDKVTYVDLYDTIEKIKDSAILQDMQKMLLF